MDLFKYSGMIFLVRGTSTEELEVTICKGGQATGRTLSITASRVLVH